MIKVNKIIVNNKFKVKFAAKQFVWPSTLQTDFRKTIESQWIIKQKSIPNVG